MSREQRSTSTDSVCATCGTPKTARPIIEALTYEIEDMLREREPHFAKHIRQTLERIRREFTPRAPRRSSGP